jgi:glycosyltransferase involved in cell wall biosynthesis
MRVHQILPRFYQGDAASNMALAIHRALERQGLDSHIYAEGLDEYGAGFARLDREYHRFVDNRDDLLIYHYAIYCENFRLYLRSRNRRVLVYHNITPAEYFEPYDPGTARLCRRGREILPLLKEGDLFLGVSEFNRGELLKLGFEEERTGVLPAAVDVGALGLREADYGYKASLMDGRVNLLHVGRVVPNKRIEDIIKLFYYYHRFVNACSRLVLVGKVFRPYAMYLWRMVDELDLNGNVSFMGLVDPSRLKTSYQCADFYISMSEHEGFCVPLLEAFHFGIPVLAYAAGAVPETMGNAGALFTEKDYPLLGEFLEALRHDAPLRERIVEAQKLRLEEFSEEAFQGRLLMHLGRFLQ